MKIDVIAAPDAPRPGGAYSHAIRANGILALSGQVGIKPDDGTTPDGVAAQTRQALSNLETVLQAAGGSLASLIKTTCFLQEIDSFAEFNEAYEEVMGKHRPARSTVGVALAAGYLVEIEGLAVVDAPDPQPSTA